LIEGGYRGRRGGYYAVLVEKVPIEWRRKRKAGPVVSLKSGLGVGSVGQKLGRDFMHRSRTRKGVSYRDDLQAIKKKKRYVMKWREGNELNEGSGGGP